MGRLAVSATRTLHLNRTPQHSTQTAGRAAGAPTGTVNRLIANAVPVNKTGVPSKSSAAVTAQGKDGNQQMEAFLDGLISGQSTTTPISTVRNLRKRGHCYGCGMKLQTGSADSPGFVPPEKYAVKEQHRQLDQVLCNRCTALSNGEMIPAVEDFTQRTKAAAASASRAASDADDVSPSEAGAAATGASTAVARSLVTPDELRAQLLAVREQKAVVVLLVDLLDVQGSLLRTLRDIVGRNPVVLVATKMDLLPAGTHPKDVTQWLLEAAERRKLKVVSVHLISSRTHEGVPAVAARIRAERKGRDVYVMGAANVGKSAFVRALLREMASFESASYDPAALGNGRYLPVESAMPGTTLGIIPLQAFATGGTLYDTPGVHLHHRLIHMLEPEELRLLHPRKKLRPSVPPPPSELPQDTPTGASRPASGATGVSASYIWSDLVRLDVGNVPASTVVAFYGPSSMRVAAHGLLPAPAAEGREAAEPSAVVGMSQQEEGEEADDEDGALSCAQSVAARGGLVAHLLEVPADGRRAALADVAVSGLPGWATIWAPNIKTKLKLRVWAPKGVEVFLRPPMPCPPPAEVLQDDQTPRKSQQAPATEEQAEEAAEAYIAAVSGRLRKQGMEVVPSATAPRAPASQERPTTNRAASSAQQTERGLPGASAPPSVEDPAKTKMEASLPTRPAKPERGVRVEPPSGEGWSRIRLDAPLQLGPHGDDDDDDEEAAPPPRPQAAARLPRKVKSIVPEPSGRDNSRRRLFSGERPAEARAGRGLSPAAARAGSQGGRTPPSEAHAGRRGSGESTGVDAPTWRDRSRQDWSPANSSSRQRPEAGVPHEVQPIGRGERVTGSASRTEEAGRPAQAEGREEGLSTAWTAGADISPSAERLGAGSAAPDRSRPRLDQNNAVAAWDDRPISGGRPSRHEARPRKEAAPRPSALRRQFGGAEDEEECTSWARAPSRSPALRRQFGGPEVEDESPSRARAPVLRRQFGGSVGGGEAGSRAQRRPAPRRDDTVDEDAAAFGSWGEVQPRQASGGGNAEDFDVAALLAKFQGATPPGLSAAGDEAGGAKVKPRRKRMFRQRVAVEDLGSLLAGSGFEVVKKP